MEKVETPVFIKDQVEIINNINVYQRMNKFTKNITAIIINLTFDKNELILLKTAFKLIDKNKSGKITA